MTREQLIEIADEIRESCQNGASTSDIVMELQRIIRHETQRIRSEALQDAAAYVLANAKIKNSCCAETRASIYTLIKGILDDSI